jgi:hypothetical protein
MHRRGQAVPVVNVVDVQANNIPYILLLLKGAIDVTTSGVLFGGGINILIGVCYLSKWFTHLKNR